MQILFRRAALLGPALCAVLLFGCADSSAPRSAVSVEALNDNEPLMSDVLFQSGTQMTVFEDQVLLTIRNDPHDQTLAIDPDGPFGRVVIERYSVRFESEEAIPEVNGALGWTVPSGESVSGAIVVVPAILKLEAPLVSLVSGGEIVSTAHITFFGHEATSDDAIRFEATMPVHFANWGN